MSDTESNRDQQGSMEPTAAVPAMAEWNQHGTVAFWINMLEMYKRDSKFKWRNLTQLKRKGFKIGFDVKDRFPELHAMTVNAVDLLGITIPEQTRMEEYDQAVKDLVRIFKQMAKLVKDFRSFYSPTKASSKMLNHLAKRNPNVFQIREVGSVETGYSATIEIVDMLTATEVDEDKIVAKWLVCTKVLKYMMQLSKMVEIQVMPTMEYDTEPPLPRARSHSSILAVSDIPRPISIESVDMNDFVMEEIAQIKIMAQQLVENLEISIPLPTKTSINRANSKKKRYSTI